MSISSWLNKNIASRISSKIMLYIIGFILLSTASISSILYFGAKELVVRESVQSMQESLKLAAKDINSDIDNILRFSDTLENLVLTTIDINKVKNNDDKMEAYENFLRPIFKNEIIQKNMKSGWVIFDPRTLGGNHLVSFYESNGKLSEVPEYDIASAGVFEDEWWKSAYENGEVWTKPYYWPKWGRDIVSYSRKIEKDGVPLGVVGSEFYIDALREKISSLKIFDTGYYVLMDEDFNFIYHPDKTLNNLKEIEHGSLAYLAQKISSNPSLSGFENYTYKGIEKVMSYYKLSNGWIIAAVPRLDEMLHDLYGLRNSVIIVGCIIVIAGLAVSILFGKSTTSKIIKIKNAAVELSNGNLDADPGIVSKDELGQLAGAFNTMAENIRRAREKLEESNSALSRTTALLQEEKETLDITLKSIGDGTIVTDERGIVRMINHATENITGWKSGEVEGKPFDQIFEFFDERTRKKCKNLVQAVLKSNKITELSAETAMRTKDGSIISVADCAAPIKNREGITLGVVLTFRDITAEKRNREAIARLSNNDILTGVYNRVFAEREMKRIDDKGDVPVSIIMGDVNGLKITNDVFGHEAGDNLLKTIGSILKQALRPRDILSRWGGDEFVVIMPETNMQEAAAVCESVYAVCRSSASASGSTVPSISLGYATKESNEKDLRSVLKSAEDFMYKRKLLESRSTHSSIIASMKKTLYEKSHETEEHTSRLRDLCMRIASSMDLPENDRNDLELFSVLHDIGKITVDDRILNKPGPLSEDEWFEMRKHPETGCRIALSAVELVHISEYILTHHERWDGTGYPQGLKGTHIPLLSRILAIADAYDAMTQDRVYRKAMPKEAALAEIRAAAGTQFDPDIVDTFLKIV